MGMMNRTSRLEQRRIDAPAPAWDPAPAAPHPLLGLQRAAGNAAVASLLDAAPGRRPPAPPCGDAKARFGLDAGVQRKCARCADEEKDRPGEPGSAAPSTAAELTTRLGQGESLHEATRAKLARNFGQSFSEVRVHTDARAAQLAAGMSASAFTVGQHVAFAQGAYQPGTAHGDRLIAHELAHTIQQRHANPAVMTKGGVHDAHEQAADAAAILTSDLGLPIHGLGAGLRAPGGAPTVQMQSKDVNSKSNDPGALLCTILCYLGIPTPTWKRLVNLYLQATWEHYKATAPSEQDAKKQYTAFRIAFEGYGTFNTLKSLLTFMVHGEVAFVSVVSRSARAAALREAMLRVALKFGLTRAGLVASEKAVGKFALVIEGGIFAVCAASCTMEAYVKALVEFGAAITDGISSTAGLLTTAGELGAKVVSEAISRSILVARATVDPTNWDTSPMPSPTKTDFSAIGFYLWRKLKPENANELLSNLGKPMKVYSVPSSLITVFATGLTSAQNARKSVQVTFTPDLLEQLPLITLVKLMTDWSLLKFKKDPSLIASEQMNVATP
jgi:hypothetical protein